MEERKKQKKRKKVLTRRRVCGNLTKLSAATEVAARQRANSKSKKAQNGAKKTSKKEVDKRLRLW